MSYAIIRNAKYKSENLKGIYRHNERRNTNYSNKNIDKEKSYLNYSLKSPQFTYEKEFERIRKEYNLKGQIKTVSNIVCETDYIFIAVLCTNKYNVCFYSILFSLKSNHWRCLRQVF